MVLEQAKAPRQPRSSCALIVGWCELGGFCYTAPMSEPRITTYEEFWPFYLGEHSKASTRWMHFVGTTIGMVTLGYALATLQPLLIPLAFVPGYAFAWVSHFFIEHNRPATFKYPLWSFISDFKMWGYMLTGRIGEELKAHAIA